MWSEVLFSYWELFLSSTNIEWFLDAKSDQGSALWELTFSLDL